MTDATAAGLTAGIDFHSRWAFWAGSALAVLGVLLHVPDYVASAGTDFRMAGEAMSGEMYFGMSLIVLGVAMVAWSIVPRQLARSSSAPGATDAHHLRAMDNAPMTRAHWGLLCVLALALVIDVMKPATLGFVMPGSREEYGLTAGQIAMLPFTALSGTTIGSLTWGVLADKIGRRATILLAAIMFIGTSICGFMPSFAWNLVMCFFMGLSAGGMLPIVYALMTESMPASKRGGLVVFIGGSATIGGYMLASGFAAWLEPILSWRILWFMGLPTGVVLLFLNRWIPESPRHLLERGRRREAEAVMARYGMRFATVGPPSNPLASDAKTTEGWSYVGGLGRVFQGPYLAATTSVVLYGLGWGVINWGFLTFLPTLLGDAGFERGTASALLFTSSLIAIPSTGVVALLYGMWSSKWSMVIYAFVTTATMLGFAALGPNSAEASHAVLFALTATLLVTSGGTIAMLSPYAAEIYPTHLRGTGSGVASGSSKLGGVIAPPLIAGLMAVSPGLRLPALASAMIVMASAVALARFGVETRGRRLEEISGHGEPSVAREPMVAE